uniref:Mitochondrial thiamine pyrophosphate carrier n=1 Tax=Timema californicum TaxID=61474 RepID=A0A7R9J302_TIMCA|nr:unnamed protein product [Timema californicum]
MVGFDPLIKEKLHVSEHALAGAVSGATTRLICQPLDVIKIRFQVEPLSSTCSHAKYWGVSQAALLIAKEEGVSALWKGHVPAQLLSVTFGVTQFVTFEMLTHEAWNLAPSFHSDHYRPLVHFVCGAAAGSLATLVSFPTDVVRTRLVAQGEPKVLLLVYTGIIHSFKMILKEEGIGAFFKGLSPTLLQIAPHAGAQFAFYNLFKGLWKMSVVGSLVSGSMAGFCAKAVVYPLDLAKKRLQVQGFEQARQRFGKVFYCHGLLHCLKLTVQEEKLAGLFKGLWPSLLKAAATTALHFSVYDETCKFLGATDT